MTRAHTLIEDPSPAERGRCGYVLDRTPGGPMCGRPAEYVARFSGHDDRLAGACAEHAECIRRMPELLVIRSWP